MINNAYGESKESITEGIGDQGKQFWRSTKKGTQLGAQACNKPCNLQVEEHNFR
jgi:hypothetical protein